MKFEALMAVAGDLPVFETGLLLAGDVDPVDVRRQLSLWVKAGRLYQLRRGLYALAPPFRKVRPHPFVVANTLVPGSYVSRQSALSYHGLIPDVTPVTTSVCARRPGLRQTPLGDFDYRHVKVSLITGYHYIDVGDSQKAFVATAEKAILDLVHLTPGADDPAYLRELRLQNLDQVDLAALQQQARQIDSPKLQQAAAVVAEMAHSEPRQNRTI